MSKSIKDISIKKFTKSGSTVRQDVVAIEDPLEIQLHHASIGALPKPISITMRTPGHDVDLAIGFLFTEGMIQSVSQIKSSQSFSENNVMVSIQPEVKLKLGSLDRNFYTTSSCGVCGKASIDAIHTTTSFRIQDDKTGVDSTQLYGLQNQLLQRQSLFSETGGIHAAAIFNKELEQLQLREDVGRHNALDKLIGHFVQQNKMPLEEHILLLSGRASFELIQKAGMAGIPIIVAVGAPSSLAVELADELGMTLVGFLKEDSFNVYTHVHRIK